MAITLKSVKLAGPDVNGYFEVVSTKNTMVVLPGEFYTEKAVKEQLMPLTRGNAMTKIEVNLVKPQKHDGSLYGVDVARDRIHRG